MMNFQEFFNNLTTNHPATSTNRKDTYGYIWETKVCKWFLKNSPYWKTQFKPESIMSPEEWGYGIKSSDTGAILIQDIGIDLVAEHVDGTMWGIQAKCYTRPIPTTEIESFITALGLKWVDVNNPNSTKELQNGLLLITNQISRTMKNEIYNLKEGLAKEVVIVEPTQFNQLDLDWSKSVLDSSSIETHIPWKPLPHQNTALKDITLGWENNDRGKCIMACGTGKTLVGLWAAEDVKSKNTLVLLPSLSLVNQIANEWLKNANKDISPLFVCSDKTVKRGSDGYINSTVDLGFAVTTDPKDIVKFFQVVNSDHRVVFSTYQSSESIEDAQKLGAPKFDIIIADEAHHCAGKIKSDFARVLDGKKIKSKKRLFMTATPKYLTKRTRDQAKEKEIPVASMDDINVFGPYFHTLNFAEAIRYEPEPLLSDYRVVVNITTSKDIQDIIKRREYVTLGKGIDSDAESIGMISSFIKLIEEYGITHAITFHNRVEQAKTLSSHLKKIFPLINKKYKKEPPFIQHVEAADMTTAYRAEILKRFREASGGINILSNAKCLTEGVDIRAVDCVAFFEPKRSTIDILQAVGRAIRKNKEGKVGTIFIPVFVPEEMIDDPELSLQKSRFQDVFDIVQALKEHDKEFAQELDGMRVEIGKRKGGSDKRPSKVTVDAPTIRNISFFEKINNMLVIQTTEGWYETYGAFVAYKKEFPDTDVVKTTRYHGLNLGRWVGTQRKVNNKKALSPEKIKLLEEVGIIWDVLEEDWQQGYKSFIAYKKEFPDTPVPSRIEYHDFNLGQWVSTQRKANKNGTLSPERTKLLKDAGFIWDRLEEAWQQGYKSFIAYKKEFPDTPVPAKAEYHDFNLGQWVSTQRVAKNKKTLSPERIKLLKDAGFIWDQFEEDWQQGYKAFVAYKKEFPDTAVAKNTEYHDLNLGQWVGTQRGAKNKKTLSPERIKLLEEAGIIWDAKNSPNK